MCENGNSVGAHSKEDGSKIPAEYHNASEQRVFNVVVGSKSGRVQFAPSGVSLLESPVTIYIDLRHCQHRRRVIVKEN